MRARAVVPLLLIALLAGCSSAPATAPSRTVTPAAAITGAAAEKITAWAECQQLVIKKLNLTDSDVRKFSAQSEKPAGKAWVAVGKIATGPLAYTYRCTIASDAKGTITSESLDSILPA